jgi:putative flippase GtrA
MMPKMKRIFNLLPASFWEFVRFCVVGVLNTAVDFGIYYLATRFFGVFYLLANVLAFMFSATNSYVLNRIFTFKSKGGKKAEYLRFMLVLCSGLLISESMLAVFSGLFGLNDLFVKAAAIGVVLFWNFFGSKFFAFRIKEE